MDYLWIIKQLLITTIGTLVGFLIGKYSKKSLKSNKEQVDEKSDCHIALIINNGLKMGKGKVAAQCGHSVVGLMKQASKLNPSLYKKCVSGRCQLQLYKVDSSDEFRKLKSAAYQRSLMYYLVADAGRTQIASGSQTVFGIGPSTADVIKEIVTGLPSY